MSTLWIIVLILALLAIVVSLYFIEERLFLIAIFAITFSLILICLVTTMKEIRLVPADRNQKLFDRGGSLAPSSKDERPNIPKDSPKAGDRKKEEKNSPSKEKEKPERETVKKKKKKVGEDK